MRQLTGLNGMLSVEPEINFKQVCVVREKNFLQGAGQSQEPAEFFRKHIVFIHIKPGFRVQLIFIAGRLRNFFDMAAGRPGKCC